MRFPGLKEAAAAIEREKILLVFPIKNEPEVPSLWSVFFPRSKMRWEWDDSADSKVVNLWHLREGLSRSGLVVYAKWYRGRATFLSRSIAAYIRELVGHRQTLLSAPAKKIITLLHENSPISSKILKRDAIKQSGFSAREFDRALVELWRGLWIVGYGEIDDGAFPSLAIGAFDVLFEGLSPERGAALELLMRGPFAKQLQALYKSSPKSTTATIRFSDLVGKK